MNVTQILTGILFVIEVSLSTTILGAFIAGRISAARHMMGFDAIADFLGGVMAGAIIGLVASLVMVFTLKHGHLVKGNIIAAVVIVLEIALLVMGRLVGFW